MATQNVARQRQRRQARLDSPSVNDAHKAIARGDATLADISAMVKVVPSSARFGDEDDFTDMLPEAPSVVLTSLWDQSLFGLSFRHTFAGAIVLGIASGVPLAFLIHGTAVHLAIAAVFPFLA
ncbi:hypothetical protein L4Z68_002370 [Pseudomonas aeruginosa]|uniref:hypothetical protein n=1 Tax=Pseudomonadaceae TaxID=135621 RepID=UPI00105052C1|nr:MULTISPECIES: hypothetical protein [Pseudomonas aeruginosa group]EKU6308776.1 hypothetical protein [Pseudomonas aeruginosa]EKX2970354.1 hypothetical protein [Pseudomonas aeruginosa]BDC78547.1 hypothetical protein MRCP2_p2820 [Pseudomonas alcaligenes]